MSAAVRVGGQGFPIVGHDVLREPRKNVADAGVVVRSETCTQDLTSEEISAYHNGNT